MPVFSVGEESGYLVELVTRLPLLLTERDLELVRGDERLGVSHRVVNRYSRAGGVDVGVDWVEVDEIRTDMI